MDNFLPKMEPRIYLSENDCPGMCSHLMDSNIVNLFWKDKDRRFRGANKGFLDIYGFDSVQEILGKTDEDMGWHIDDELYHNEEIQVLTTGKPSLAVRGQVIIRGVLHEIVASKEPIYHNGEIVGLFGYFQDLGEHASRIGSDGTAVDESVVDELTGMMSAAGLMSVINDFYDKWKQKQENFGAARLTWVNIGAFEEKYGEQAVQAFLHKCGVLVTKFVKNQAIGSRVNDGNFVLIRKCEEKAPVERNAQRLLDFFHQVFAECDFTLEPELEANVFFSGEMQEKQELLSFAMMPKQVRDKVSYHQQLMADNIVTHIPSAVMIFLMTKDNHASVIYISDALKTLLGTTVDMADGIDIITDRVVPKSEEQRIRMAGWASLRNRQAFDEIFEMVNDAGEHMWCHFVTEPVMQENGDCLFYGIHTDITMQKKEEEALLEKQKERMNRYQNALSSMNDQSDGTLAMRAHFDYTDGVLVEAWYSAKRGGIPLPPDTTLDYFRKKSMEQAFSENDRQKLRKGFQLEDLQESLADAGECTRRVEYLRNADSGRTYWTNTECKALEDPENGHIHLYFSVYNAAQDHIPQEFTYLMIVNEYEKMGLFDYRNNLLQTYDLRNGETVRLQALNEYDDECRRFAETYLPVEARDRFCWAMNVRNILNELETHNGVYQYGCWIQVNGEQRRKAWKFSFVNDEHTSIIIARSDITDSYVDEEKYVERLTEMNQEIEHMHRDVTGVFTRKITIQNIRAMLKQKTSGKFGVLMVDLDNLKQINDKYGHLIGDHAISAIADALTSTFRKSDIVGRIGGDEFMVFCDSIDEDVIGEKARQTLQKVNDFLLVPDEQRYLSCSIGFYCGTYGTESFEQVYEKADQALYRAKKNGKNQICQFTEE